MKTTPVVVVGAGPTGMTVACLLARYGIDCTVVERRRGVYPLPRAVHLDDEVYRIVQNAGAAKAFGPFGRPAQGMRLVDRHNRVLMEFARNSPVGHSGWRQSTMFDQPDLERALRGAMAQNPGVELREGCVVDAITPEPDGATVRVRGESGDIDTLRARFVLGCDGASSSVARAIGGTWRDLRFTQRWLVVDVRSDHELTMWPGVHQVCAGTEASTFMRIGADRYRWEFRLPAVENDEPDERWALAAVRKWLPVDAEVEVVRTARYQHGARIAQRWRAGPLFVLGDAAHLTPPFIGQGLGAGQRDAMNLAWKLAHVLDGRGDERLLDSYQAERAPHVLRSVIAATAVGRAMAVRSPPARIVVDTVMRGLDAAPGAATIGPRFIYPRLGRRAIPLRRRLRRGGGRLGALFPQFVVQAGTDGALSVGSDEVLGAGHALVRAGPPSKALGERARAVGARSLAVSDFGPAAHQVGEWLHDAHLRAVLVRPDRVVCDGDSTRGTL
jgi:3-(3-hydroxy-phenyl)propionate hydroxylase